MFQFVFFMCIEGLVIFAPLKNNGISPLLYSFSLQFFRIDSDDDALAPVTAFQYQPRAF